MGGEGTRLAEDFRDLLRAFVAHDVRFLVVGAYALAVLGRPRATADLDVWIDARPANAKRTFAALPTSGLRSGISASKTSPAPESSFRSASAAAHRRPDRDRRRRLRGRLAATDHRRLRRRRRAGDRPGRLRREQAGDRTPEGPSRCRAARSDAAEAADAPLIRRRRAGCCPAWGRVVGRSARARRRTVDRKADAGRPYHQAETAIQVLELLDDPDGGSDWSHQWRRGESNPRPKAHPRTRLRA